jgi:hypothetical protein
MNDSMSRTSPVKVQIPPDGKITLPWGPQPKAAGGHAAQSRLEIDALGKTPEQLQRETATMVAGRYQSSLVFVNLFSAGSREELRREFDNALRDAAERRSNSR